MAEIISLEKLNKKFTKITIELNSTELKNLRGHMEDIMIFSKNVIQEEIVISRRGKKSASCYFKIPLSMRKRLKKDRAKVHYFETEKDMVFAYTVPKKKR